MRNKHTQRQTQKHRKQKKTDIDKQQAHRETQRHRDIQNQTNKEEEREPNRDTKRAR